jgi:hypothetical protein
MLAPVRNFEKPNVSYELRREKESSPSEIPYIDSPALIGQARCVKKRIVSRGRRGSELGICLLPFLFCVPLPLTGAPPPGAVSAFEAYIANVEGRIDQQHLSPSAFSAPAASDPESAKTRVRQGQVIIERLTPVAGAELPGALLHHWRGTAFVQGATAADFGQLLRGFDSYPKYFSPQVVQAKVLSHDGDHFVASMRVRQRHFLTVVMDATYDVTFGWLDAERGYSISRSTRIAEIDSPGTIAERSLSDGEEHGFLWRLTTYWTWEERDGGLYLQIEAVSLSRSVPRGLGWLVAPYAESIPRESLDFTLRSVCSALRK